MIRYTIIVSLLMLTACTRGPYSPQPLHNPETFSSYQSKTIGDVTVSIAILTDQEAKSHFALDLGKHGIQALWLRVKNASPDHYWHIRNVLDPDLYSPDEVARIVHSEISGDYFEKMRQFLRDDSMPVLMKPGMITQGHVFIPREEGGRYVEVRLVSDVYEAQTGASRNHDEHNVEKTSSPEVSFSELRFDFALMLPDGLFDFEQIDLEQIYSEQNLPDLNQSEVRSQLENLPCCATNDDGDRNGDPLNVVLVGEFEDVMYTLTRAGWSFTHKISLETVKRLAAAALEGEGYAVAPVSSLYAFGRKQDIALQRARRNIAQRNHMRLWLAPFTHLKKPVWVGQVSRDIGIKFTTHSPSFTTHVIDPEIDLTRKYLFHSLLAEGFVKKFGLVSGSKAASFDSPATNLANDPYFSDGLRLFVILSSRPVAFTEVRSMLWEQSRAPMAEGQSEEASRNVYPIGSEREN